MGAQRVFSCAVVLVLGVAGLSGVTRASAEAGRPSLPGTPPGHSKPNVFNPRSDTASLSHQPQLDRPAGVAGGPAARAHAGVGAGHPSARPVSLALHPGGASRVMAAHGQLEADVPAGALSAADIRADGGAAWLRVSQTMPPSGTSAGGSGHIMLGSYLLQLVDARGRLVRAGLRHPLTLRLHVPTENPGSATAVVTSQAAPGFGGVPPVVGHARPGIMTAPVQTAAPAVHRMTLTGGGGMLVTIPVTAGTTTVTFAATTPVAEDFGAADPFSVNLGSGSLGASYPISTPAGPGGLSPSLALRYDSASVSEQHDPMAAAPWVGEGWDMSMGEITWKEDQTAQYWESSWHIQDPYGLSDDLVPPKTTVSTYYDLSGNSITPGPLRWHTATESHAKIYSYTGPLSLPGMSAKPPCFRVFLPNGIMEEFGCTLDSLSYYPSDTSYHIRAWLLDLITDPHGDQIHISYQQDMTTGGSSGKMKYPRDTELSTVEWDSPGCAGTQAAQTACSTGGTAPNQWAPLMRVSFAAAHSVTRFTGTPTVSNKNGCNTLPMRCDDPWYTNPPLQQSTFALNDILVQVRGSGSASWNTLRDYQFTYQQTGVHQFQDPWTGQNTQAAGQLDLTKFQEVGDDGSATEPARSFSYASLTQYYADMDFPAGPGPTVTFGTYGGITVTQNNCGPSWNWWTPVYAYYVTDVNGEIWNVYDCALWSQSYAGNSDYLSSVSNGEGLAQSFSWANAYPNVEGVPKIDGVQDPGNPLACDGHESTGPCGTDSVYQEWSRAVLTKQAGTVLRASSAGSQSVTSTTSYRYRLTTPVPAQPKCNSAGRCFVATMYWRPLFHFDPGDFNDERFMGFSEVDVTNPDGSVDKHHYYTTDGIGMYDTSIPCIGGFCHASAWWSPDNALHGREYKDDVYDTDGTTLLSETDTQYKLTCPPEGVSGSPSWKDSKDTDSGFPYTFTWDGQLVTEISNVDPVAVCDIQVAQVDTYTYDGASPTAAVPHSVSTYSYDAYGRITSATNTTSDGGATGSPTTVTIEPTYTKNDSVTATSTAVTGTYLIDLPEAMTTVSADGSRHLGCETYGYDGQPGTPGQNSAITFGDVTQQQDYTSCGTSANGFTPSGAMTVTGTFDGNGNLIAVDDANANAGDTSHLGCTPAGGSTGVTAQYSACMSNDHVFGTEPATTQDALGQTVTQGYGSPTDPAAGFGTWPVSLTDPNGQVTTQTYDAFGRQTSTTLPGETGPWSTSTSYDDWCSGTAAQGPCVEVDNVKRVNDSATVTARTFYDGWGRPVETRTSGPGGQDVVSYTDYDPSGRAVFRSIQYDVAAYTGQSGAAAFSVPDASQPGTTTDYPSARQTTVTDALSGTTTTTQSVACAITGTNDSACYAVSSVIDPRGSQRAVFSDAFGRSVYSRSYTGDSTSTYASYATTTTIYDELGDVTKVINPDGSTHTYTYDDAGQLISETSPDSGTTQYSYDAGGNLTETVDARGAQGTTFYGYDGLGRMLWRNTADSPQGAFATYSYDSTANGNMGVGQLTGETFSGGGMSGSRGYLYNARGLQAGSTLTVDGSSYNTSQSYDDAGDVTSQTYPDGNVVTSSYDGGGWLTGVALQQSSGSSTLASGLSYDATGQVTRAVLGGGVYDYSGSYDLLGRISDTRLTGAGTGATLFDQARTYDAAGNVTSTVTTLPQGTDTQQFCYDEQDRLTWAGSTGTPPCTGQAITPGTLSAAYSQSFGYDTMDRMISGLAGTYSYDDPAHIDAVTAATSGYGASYDPAGNMTCRSATTATSCASGALTGANMSYDSEGRLIGWQSAQSSPAQTVSYLYDGEGTRVARQTTSDGTSTTTVYVAGMEEVTTGGGATTTTDYYAAAGTVLAASVNGTLYFLGADGLGSIDVALDTSGNVLASQLYTPYGDLRYSSGAMPTSHGFTGQIADATGLIDDGARTLDPVTGLFTTADTVQDGPNGYAYVHDNPETLTDPSGHASGPGEDWKPSTRPQAPSLAKVLVAMALLGSLSGQINIIDQAVQALEGLTHGQSTAQVQTQNPGANDISQTDDSVDEGSESGTNLLDSEKKKQPKPGPAPWNDRRTRGMYRFPSRGLYSVQVSTPVPVIETFPVTPSIQEHILPQPPPPPPALVQPPVTVLPVTPPLAAPQPSPVNGIQGVNSGIPGPSAAPTAPVLAGPPAVAAPPDPLTVLSNAASSAMSWYSSLSPLAQAAIGIGAVIVAATLVVALLPEEALAGLAVAGTLAAEFSGQIAEAAQESLAAAEEWAAPGFASINGYFTGLYNDFFAPPAPYF